MSKYHLLLAVLLFGVGCAADVTSSPVRAPSDAAQLGRAPSDPTGAFYLANDAGLDLRGDGLSTYLETSSPLAGMSRYRDGECGVQSKLFASSGGSGDAILGTAQTQDRLCAAYPRKVWISYEQITAPGSTALPVETVSRVSWMNVRQLERAASNGNLAVYIPIGSSADRTFNFSDDGYKCGTAGTLSIGFVPVTSTGLKTGADYVTVARVDSSTWNVTTKPDETVNGQTIHHDKAYCAGDGHLYHMPLRLTIKMNSALSP